MDQSTPENACRFRVGGMDCPDCSRRFEQNLSKLPGVQAVELDFLSGRLLVRGDGVTANDITRRVKELGYSAGEVQGMTAGRDAVKPPLLTRTHRRQALEAAAAVLAVSAGGLGRYWGLGDAVALPLIITGIVIGGWRIAPKGVKAAARLQLDINFLMSAAVLGAMFIGEWTEAGVVIALFAVAELLEAASLDRSRRAVESLMNLTPTNAVLLEDGSERVVPAAEVKVGDLLLIKPGTSIPVDAVVEAGMSEVNQAVVTGESMPVLKEPGDTVLAGSINGDGALQVRAQRVHGATTIDRIAALVDQARRAKAPAQKFVDRFAAVYTPAVIVVAVLTALIPPLFFDAEPETWVYRALALMVIACPCALVISTPIAVVSALTGAARNGVLVKGGIFLESLSRLKAVALDKTGTVTRGRFAVQTLHPLNGLNENDMLTTAATVELHSEHPIAAAVLRRASEAGLHPEQPSGYRALPGRGATAVVAGETVWVGNHALFEELGICDGSVHELLAQIEGKDHTAVLVGTEDKLAGVISIADEIRSESAAAARELKAGGVRRLALLTGDNHRTGAAVGRAVGVDEVHAELQPEDKIDLVRDLHNRFGTTAMVGDGVNDAPALAAADIGVAMGGGGSDASLETADVVLMADRMERLPWLHRLSRKTYRIIRFNIGFALLMKLVFVVLAITGNATLWMAVFADMGVSMLVIFNGMRALRSS